MDSPSITETQVNIITHTIDEETKAWKDKGYAPGVGAGWWPSEERPGNTERSTRPRSALSRQKPCAPSLWPSAQGSSWL